MNLTRTDLDNAVQRGVIAPDQADALWAFLCENSADTPSFRFPHILYYLGGLVAIGAMTLFMTLGWRVFGGWGLFFIALAYAVAGLRLTDQLLKRQRLLIPAGIVGAFVVALTPLAIYGVQSAFGMWAPGSAYREYHSLVDWRWILMELGTLATGAAMLWRYRLPFLVMPVAVTLWYMTMDVTSFLFGADDANLDLRKFVSLCFGLLMVLLAFWTDLRTRDGKDYPFWLYFFGVFAFWCGLSAMQADSELERFIYLCINLLMIVVGAVLSRRVFAVFGGLGAAGYVGYLSYQVFKDSVMFPFVLTAIGIFIIYLGMLWQRHEQDISFRLRSFLPAALRELVERRH